MLDEVRLQGGRSAHADLRCRQAGQALLQACRGGSSRGPGASRPARRRLAALTGSQMGKGMLGILTSIFL
jgi:hypothetical protein